MRTDTMEASLIENRINYVVIQYDMSRATRATLVKRRLLDAAADLTILKSSPLHFRRYPDGGIIRVIRERERDVSVEKHRKP